MKQPRFKEHQTGEDESQSQQIRLQGRFRREERERRIAGGLGEAELEIEEKKPGEQGDEDKGPGGTEEL